MICDPRTQGRIANFRVVFLETRSGKEVLSQPSDRRGTYTAEAAAGEYNPVAVLDWDGNRIPLRHRKLPLRLLEGLEYRYDACSY